MNLMEKYLTKLKQNERQNRPVRDILTEKYKELTGWLHQFDLGQDELKEIAPSLYLEIQDCIQRLDNAFYREDFTAFQDALDRVKSLYAEALFKCGRKVAVKVYSEVLQAYL